MYGNSPGQPIRSKPGTSAPVGRPVDRIDLGPGQGGEVGVALAGRVVAALPAGAALGDSSASMGVGAPRRAAAVIGGVRLTVDGMRSERSLRRWVNSHPQPVAYAADASTDSGSLSLTWTSSTTMSTDGDLEAEQVLHGADDVGADLLGHGVEHEAVLDHERDLHGRGGALQPDLTPRSPCSRSSSPRPIRSRTEAKPGATSPPRSYDAGDLTARRCRRSSRPPRRRWWWCPARRPARRCCAAGRRPATRSARTRRRCSWRTRRPGRPWSRRTLRPARRCSEANAPTRSPAVAVPATEPGAAGSMESASPVMSGSSTSVRCAGRPAVTSVMSASR